MSSPPPSAPTRRDPAARKWTRRRWLGTAVTGLASSGCGWIREHPFRRAIVFTDEINILVWQDYFPDAVIEKFERATAIRVVQHYFDSNDQLPGLLRDKKVPYDLAMPSTFMAQHLRELGLLLTFSRDGLTNLGQVDRKTFNARFDPDNRYIVPYIWGSTGIGYNATSVEGLPKSWASLFRLNTHVAGRDVGRVSVLDDANFTIGSVLVYLGFNPETANRTELDAAAEVLMRVRDRITHFESTNVAGLLANGVVELALLWSGDVTTAIKGDPKRKIPANRKIRLSLPSEGSIFFKDNFVVPRSAKNRLAAERFLDYLLLPHVAGAVTNYSLYATTIPAARPFVDRLISNGPSYFRHPAGQGKNFSLEDTSRSDDVRQKIWADLKAKPVAPAAINVDRLPRNPPAANPPGPAPGRPG
jgi:spermidine/putrescine-binding protein